MVGFIPGADRSQAMLLPIRIEDYIREDCAVRVIDAYVASLDLHKLGFEHARPAQTGRPGFDPADMLKHYIHGYLNALRSSRKLEKACRTNLEIISLRRTLHPDYKTIADFRRDNYTGIVGTSRGFVQFCREASLFAAQIARVCIDGKQLPNCIPDGSGSHRFGQARLFEARYVADFRRAAGVTSTLPWPALASMRKSLR